MPAARKPRAPAITEDQLQAQIVDYLSWALGDNAMFFAVPNGGSRHWLEAKNLKRRGATAGIPDLEILHRGRALFVELKTKSGALEDSQKFTIPRIERAGCPVAVCRSLDAVQAFLRNQGVPLRTESITTERIRRGFEAARDPSKCRHGFATCGECAGFGPPPPLTETIAGMANDTLEQMIDEAADA